MELHEDKFELLSYNTYKTKKNSQRSNLLKAPSSGLVGDAIQFAILNKPFFLVICILLFGADIQGPYPAFVF